MRAVVLTAAALLSLFAAGPALAQQSREGRSASLRAPVLEEIRVPPGDLLARALGLTVR